jgi:SAM-dependent methyltransferase
MYKKSAWLYDSLYHFRDYRASAARVHELVQSRRPGAASLLDVACGTGKHLEQLGAHYDVEGVDINPDMLHIARGRCSGVMFHLGDMADFHLGRKFDAVICLFGSIAAMKTVADLERAATAIAAHLNPGGVLLVEPWFGPDNYWTGHITANFADEPELKIAWMYTSEREGRLSKLLAHYLVGRPEGVEYFTELYELGLFTDEEYVRSFKNAGLTAITRGCDDLFRRGLFLGNLP